MTLSRRLQRLLDWSKSQRLLILSVCVILFVMGQPWNTIIDHPEGATVFGFRLGYLAKYLLAPALIITIVSFFIQRVEDNDRHTPDLENE